MSRYDAGWAEALDAASSAIEHLQKQDAPDYLYILDALEEVAAAARDYSGWEFRSSSDDPKLDRLLTALDRVAENERNPPTRNMADPPLRSGIRGVILDHEPFAATAAGVPTGEMRCRESGCQWSSYANPDGDEWGEHLVRALLDSGAMG